MSVRPRDVGCEAQAEPCVCQLRALNYYQSSNGMPVASCAGHTPTCVPTASSEYFKQSSNGFVPDVHQRVCQPRAPNYEQSSNGVVVRSPAPRQTFEMPVGWSKTTCERERKSCNGVRKVAGQNTLSCMPISYFCRGDTTYPPWPRRPKVEYRPWRGRCTTQQCAGSDGGGRTFTAGRGELIADYDEL